MLQYIIIIPAYNEEAFLPNTLSAISRQTHLPTAVIVVNDGSSDRTKQVIDEFEQKYNWIRGLHSYEDKGYKGGSKIVAAFDRGYDSIQQPYDFLVKLDADIEVPPNYFETISNHFSKNSKLGLVGGQLLTEKNGEWIYENIGDKDHVKGAYKAWRKQTFEDIGGLRKSIGWDTADEILTQFYGWQVKVDESLPIKHYRPLGTQTGFFKVRVRIGYSLYRMRYGLFITLVSAAKSGLRDQPYLLSGLGILVGWLIAFFRQDAFMVNKEEGRFIRKFRMRRFLKKLSFGK